MAPQHDETEPFFTHTYASLSGGTSDYEASLDEVWEQLAQQYHATKSS